MDRSVKGRPALLRALGRNEPPPWIEIDDRPCCRVEIFKHDSWAATALYRGAHTDVVCKFNRVQSIFGLPMTWLGRWLAAREAHALQRLAGVQGIPAECGPVCVLGRRLDNAVAHRYIPGHPLGAHERPSDEFFPLLLTLLKEVHGRGIAYVDLHKRENLLVGTDNKPYLIDFQVCFGPWQSHLAKRPALQTVLSALQNADLYHLTKHVKCHRPDQFVPLQLSAHDRHPSWIRLHRTVAAPLRQLRRKLLAALGVRGRSGRAATEAFPEHAIRCEAERAA